jgi:hypothetical protein
MGYTIDYDLVEDGVESKGLKKKGMLLRNWRCKFYFEGISDPADNTILYVLKVMTEIKDF